MKKILLRCCFSIVFCTVSFSANASNYSFLADSPISFFNDQDAKIYAATLQDTLNNHRDGSKVSWKNPKSTAFGYMIASNTTKHNGVLCRNLTTYTDVKKRTSQSTFKFCKMKGVWRGVS